MDPNKKRTFNPWAIEKKFTQEIGSKPATIRSNNESDFVIEISNKKESENLPTITSLCSPQFQERVEVGIFACDKINQSHGLIYFNDYNIPEIEDYDSELKKEHNLLDVKKATWIKTKTITSTPLLLTFKEKEPPMIIENLGEQAKTKVYEYYERPRNCKTCLKYGHTVKIYHETIATRAKCSCQGHNKNKCTSTAVRCCYCGDDHQAFSRNRPIFKKETEIVQIQTKEHIPR